MKRHILERIAQQVEFASQDAPNVEDMSADNFQRRGMRPIVVAEATATTNDRFDSRYLVRQVHA